MWAGAVPGRQEVSGGGGGGGLSEHHTSREVYAAAEHISVYRYERLAGGESLKRRERERCRGGRRGGS